ncbi:unnamed protein product [Trifolium pratense]|uniref:Uncharacterized protein n=1 Tax=Trifolium pratense TaxID=57577 RepID=A0ACB0KDZ5_TRIPR|nr:unnamed protein product [Trifolium pratense]
MYTNFNLTFSRAAYTHSHFPSTLQQQQNQLGEYDSATQPNSEVNYSNGGGSGDGGSRCSSYMGSPSNYEERLMQRSISSHSLEKNDGHHHHHPHLFPNLFAELLDTENGPVRRVYSTGDLDQKVNGWQQHYHQSDSPLSTESNMIIEEMSRAACPYSPEEKKVRIERYKTKRNQRNYNKKIKYVCRKTLADSRPRIRGRFAKNDEIVINPPNQWSHISNNEEEILEDEEDENWDNFFDSLVPSTTSNLAHEEPQHSSSFGIF